MSIALACVSLAACSDDKDEPSDDKTPGQEQASAIVKPSNVFTGLMPKSVAGTSIVRNADGLVTEMRTADGTVMTFEYPTTARASQQNNNVIMRVDEDGDIIDYTLTIGDNGFVSHAYVKVDASTNHNADEEGEWTFSYDNNGHLTQARHEYVDIYGEEDYTVTLVWAEDNIIKTYKDDHEGGEWDSYSYQYTSLKYPTAIENKGALLLFEDIYPIELYNFEWVYYAGMLGKGPKNLAVSCYENEDEDDEVYITNFIWALDQNGYPTEFDIDDDEYNPDMPLKFTWN